jgi:hypothetical protein
MAAKLTAKENSPEMLRQGLSPEFFRASGMGTLKGCCLPNTGMAASKGHTILRDVS